MTSFFRLLQDIFQRLTKGDINDERHYYCAVSKSGSALRPAGLLEKPLNEHRLNLSHNGYTANINRIRNNQ